VHVGEPGGARAPEHEGPGMAMEEHHRRPVTGVAHPQHRLAHIDVDQAESFEHVSLQPLRG
jgi:hypothetical protein